MEPATALSFASETFTEEGVCPLPPHPLLLFISLVFSHQETFR